jgi:hypothetical protein
MHQIDSDWHYTVFIYVWAILRQNNDPSLPILKSHVKGKKLSQRFYKEKQVKP